jgi:hypothetical protein
VSAVVLAAIGNPYRFENTSRLIKLAGLNLNANRGRTRSDSAIPVIRKKGKKGMIGDYLYMVRRINVTIRLELIQ